jgi:hypothetical protein
MGNIFLNIERSWPCYISALINNTNNYDFRVGEIIIVKSAQADYLEDETNYWPYSYLMFQLYWSKDYFTGSIGVIS